MQKQKSFFVESKDQFRRLEVRDNVSNVFAMSLRLSDLTASHLHQVFSISLEFSRFFRSYFVLPKFWSLSNLIKQLFH